MKRNKLLVVDDEHLIRWSLEQNLIKQGYEVVTAGSGEDALRLLREEQPDLVLLDIQLPGMSGLDVLEKIKEHDDVKWVTREELNNYNFMDADKPVVKKLLLR